MMINVGFLLLLLSSSLVTGAIWSPSPHPHRHEVIVKKPHGVVVVEFEEQREGNTKVLISQHNDSGIGTGAGGNFGGGRRSPIVEDAASAKAWFSSLKELSSKFRHKLATVLEKSQNVVSGKAHQLEELAKEAMDESKLSEKLSDGAKYVGETAREVAGNALSEKLSDGAKSVGEKAKEAAGTVKSTVGKAIGSRIAGTLKDSVVKMENWDVVDSPKRIGEDIESNVSRKIEQGNEEIEEIKETSLNELLRRSKTVMRDIFLMVSLEKLKAGISWCHLFGFSTAYGMGVWFTFVSSCVLVKCLPKQQFRMVVNKMYSVYFRAMAYCVGAALLGHLVSQGTKGILSNKMEMFQGFNLLSALVMILTNLIFLEPRATKLMVKRKKMKEKGTKNLEEREGGWNEKLKKLNAYSSTLNVSTLVVLTWHLAYIGQLLQARHD